MVGVEWGVRAQQSIGHIDLESLKSWEGAGPPGSPARQYHVHRVFCVRASTKNRSNIHYVRVRPPAVVSYAQSNSVETSLVHPAEHSTSRPPCRGPGARAELREGGGAGCVDILGQWQWTMCISTTAGGGYSGVRTGREYHDFIAN